MNRVFFFLHYLLTTLILVRKTRRLLTILITLTLTTLTVNYFWSAISGCCVESVESPWLESQDESHPYNPRILYSS